MQENVVLPVLNYEGKDPKLDLEVTQEKVHSDLNIGLKIVWGFGGYNAATIFKKIG